MDPFIEVEAREGIASETRAPKPASQKIAVVGLGYVGLPTALALRQAGQAVLGIDVSQKRLAEIRDAQCDLTPADQERLAKALGEERFELTDECARLAEADAVIICVPTPIDGHQVPDLRALDGACESVCRYARAGQTIILTSTTYVGATRDLLVAPLTGRGLVVGVDICVAFSPERIDPANTSYPQEMVPRVLGASSPRCARKARRIVSAVAPSVHVVSSPEAAEMTKLYENVFRAVNVTLANEMAEAAHVLGLSAPEIVDAAATKPYGFMPFQPGPGVGGHCIPCDPHYLLWQLRPHHSMPLVERAMTGIAQRPRRVADRAAEVLAEEAGRGLADARVLLVGVAYKPGVADVRESSAVTLIDLLHARGAQVEYHDPLVPVVERGGETLITVPDPDPSEYDLVIAHTLHPEFDYEFLQGESALLDCTYRLPGRNAHP
ncbi:MAG TPA: nucleotide sugar dehydrogenase [Solirubrobacterales bacterium]|jgi:nucleotide sugar dehydrogenase|nr:nucleotide sugar dehydrogenase [Solirubrobacterales bacterium]